MTLTNGLGGFTDEGRAYTIVLEGDQETPLPWANVIANPGFGTIVTASGSAHTWSENSRENRLTSFANDPIVDPTAEALFIRDDESGERVVADAGTDAAPSGERAVRHPSFGRRHAVLPRDARHQARARRVRGRRRSGQVLAADADQRRRHAADAEPLRLQRLGARAAAREPDRADHDDLRRGERDDPGAQSPTATSSPSAWRSRTPARCRARRPGIACRSSDATDRSTGRTRCAT